MLSTNLNKLLRNTMRTLSDIKLARLLAPKPTPILPLVLGALGVAIVGGIVAVMVFSPRTRYRALDIAKDGYGKARRLGRRAEKLRGGRSRSTSDIDANGLINESYAPRDT